MADRGTWSEVRERRMSEPGAREAYDAARLAFELGATMRRLREAKGWSQTELAVDAGMTQSAVARFEAGGTIPTLSVLLRLARALDADLVVKVAPHPDVA
jgi:ribosome-binding protein aMBF1 (putative translation factor)